MVYFRLQGVMSSPSTYESTDASLEDSPLIALRALNDVTGLYTAHNMAYLLKARTVDPKKELMLANGPETIFVLRNS
jgi:hypothetical protein